jgi:drug/metabolite transporter (DMT)-like permease
VRLRILIAFAAIYLIWGSTYLAIAFAVAELPPFLMAAARNIAAGGILYIWLRSRGAPRPDWDRWRESILVGVVLLAIANGAVSWSGRREPSGVIALVVSLVPLWLLVLEGIARRGARPSYVDLAGVVLGLVGILLLVAPWGGEVGAVTALGLVVLLISTFAWAYGSLYSRSLPARPAPFLGTAMEMIAGGSALLILSGLSGEWSVVDLSRVTPRGAIAFAYLVIFGSIVGFSAYKWLLTKVRPALVGTYAFVNPVVAVALGAMFAGEALSPRIIGAMLLIVAAVAMISLRPYLRRP